MTNTRYKFPLNLQLFAEDPNEGANPNGEGAEGGNEGGEQKPQTGTMIPKARFDEVNNRYKDVQKQLDELLAAKRAAEEEEQRKRGEFEQLYTTASEQAAQFKTQAEQIEARARALEGVITGLLETKLSAIPENMRELVPDNLAAEAKLAWIDKAQAAGLFGKHEPKPVGGASNPSTHTQISVNEMSPFQLLQAGYGSK